MATSERVSLDALTREIVEWQRETFPHGTPASCVAHLVEEVAELSANPTDPSEIADCYFLIVGAANRAGVDLVAAVRDKLAVNRARVWGNPDANGVVNHVREATPTPPPARGEEAKPLSVAEQVPLFDAVNRFADSPRLSSSRGKAVVEIVRAVESVIRARLTATEARLAEAEAKIAEDTYWRDGDLAMRCEQAALTLEQATKDLEAATQQRDDAVAIAREAVDELDTVGDCCGCGDAKTLAAFAARLAKIGGEG